MRKFIGSILVLCFTLGFFASGAQAGIDTKVTVCSYLNEEGQLCLHDGRKTICVERPEEYALETSVVQTVDDLICVEKSTIKVGKSSAIREGRRVCGPVDDVDFYKNNRNLFCKPIGNEESGMRIGN